MFTKKFWIDAAERVIATGAQALLATLTVSEMDWDNRWQVTGVAALAALLKALVASQVGSSRTAAMLPAGVDTERG